jgi:thioredoxin 1
MNEMNACACGAARNNDIEKKEDSPCGCGSGSRCGGKGKWIWIALAVAVAAVVVAKRSRQGTAACSGDICPLSDAPAAAVAPAVIADLPRLVDLGADKCIPCKMMAPILDDLRKTYAGRMDVVFIDVWQNPDAGKKYGINVIPTQIFYDAAGKELFRHDGFFGKDDILAKWKELGVRP